MAVMVTTRECPRQASKGRVHTGPQWTERVHGQANAPVVPRIVHVFGSSLLQAAEVVR